MERLSDVLHSVTSAVAHVGQLHPDNDPIPEHILDEAVARAAKRTWQVPCRQRITQPIPFRLGTDESPNASIIATTVSISKRSRYATCSLHRSTRIQGRSDLLRSMLDDATVKTSTVANSTMSSSAALKALVISSDLLQGSKVVRAYVRHSTLENSVVCCGARVSGCHLVNTRVCGGQLVQTRLENCRVVKCVMVNSDQSGFCNYGYINTPGMGRIRLGPANEAKANRHLRWFCWSRV